MPKILCLVCIALILVDAQAQRKETTVAASPKTASMQQMPDPAAIDRSADPCTNFYQYACGGWLARNPVPADESRWRRFNEVADRNTTLLYSLLQRAARDPKKPLQVKYGNYFAACMNPSVANALGISAMKPLLNIIDGLHSKKDLGALLGRLDYEEGQQLFFDFDVWADLHNAKQESVNLEEGIFSLHSRNDYLSNNQESINIRNQYLAHLQRMFLLMGDTKEQAAKEAGDTLSLETSLAQATVEDNDPAKSDHRMSIPELQNLTPDFDWKAYLQNIHQSTLTTVNVSNLDFYRALNQIIRSSDIQALRNYMRLLVVERYARFMGDAFRSEHSSFFGSVLEGQNKQTPLWKQCTTATDIALMGAVGQDWVQENFPPSSKRSMEQMTEALRKALREQIASLDWMSLETRREAEAKLDKLRVLIGYPDHWQDYSTLEISRENAAQNQIAVNALHRRFTLDQIGKERKPDQWSLPPDTVSAYTSFADNTSVFPAGILQPPFFRESADIATNFGAIGSIIGHEMTHGFDTIGSKYDAKGNLRNWWTSEDRNHFNANAQCIIDEYSKFTIAPGVPQDGKRTVGENISDNGGLIIAYKALMATLAKEKHSVTNTDEFSPEQRFFLGFAQIHCQNQTEQNIRALAKSDPHSADIWRVNGTVQNMPEFASAFHCTVGAPLNPANACHIW